MKNKKAAMEMSVGTIVTIVLLMSVLILGIFLIQNIFRSAKGAIDLTDQQLKDRINKLFASDEDKKMILYPESRKVEIKKGESDEFAFVINNKNNQEETFSYKVSVGEVGSNCEITEREAENMIALGQAQKGIRISSGDVLESPIRVRITVPESTSLCEQGIRYNIEVEDRSGIYTFSDIDIIIK